MAIGGPPAPVEPTHAHAQPPHSAPPTAAPAPVPRPPSNAKKKKLDPLNFDSVMHPGGTEVCVLKLASGKKFVS